MSQSSQSLATNSQIQSSSVDEISSSAEQTDTQVKSNAAAATTASQLVTGASEVAEGGKAKINEMVSAMEGIRASSQDIAKIIKVIDEIAFQTNLLALNAAVEAARAGQHGRGFAVVAQEVRNLAGRSAKAARETSDLIEDASTRVQAGVKIADETSRAFVSIADDITKVRTLVSEIATASGEQSRGVAQINVAIGEVAKSALSTSQQAEELAASAAEMQATTESMLAEVGRYRLRRRAPAAAVSVPGLNLDGLPAELMTQIQALIARQMAAPAGTSVSLIDRDSRGYANF
jgi:methyl-accepting chemotaxis protein